jgi:hypothetical protein
MRTFLWVYGHEVLEAQGLTSLEIFRRAREAYRNLADVEPLGSIATSEEYFTARRAGSSDGAFVIVKLGALNKRRTSGKRRQAAHADNQQGEADMVLRLTPQFYACSSSVAGLLTCFC